MHAGVKAYFAGGSKQTPAPKMTVEVVGTTGRIVMDNAGDGRDKDGGWTGTYRASAQIYRDDGTNDGKDIIKGQGEVAEEISPSEEYIQRITPPQPGGKDAAGNPDNSNGGPMAGIAAGVHDLIGVISAPSGTTPPPLISPGDQAQHVVEVMAGFVASANGGNNRVQLPLPRVETETTAAVDVMVARI